MEKFLRKNLKWITFLLLILFMIKSFQSCMRQTQYEMAKREKAYVEDSLNARADSIEEYWESRYNSTKNVLTDSVKELSYKIDLYKSKASEAERRAVAVQATAEKIRANTTISIEDRREEATEDSTKTEEE